MILGGINLTQQLPGGRMEQDKDLHRIIFQIKTEVSSSFENIPAHRFGHVGCKSNNFINLHDQPRFGYHKNRNVRFGKQAFGMFKCQTQRDQPNIYTSGGGPKFQLQNIHNQFHAMLHDSI